MPPSGSKLQCSSEVYSGAQCAHDAGVRCCRAFMWGAKSGREQLPPFPEPTHKAGFACGVPNTAKDCIVTFQSMEAFEKAHWMVRRFC